MSRKDMRSVKAYIGRRCKEAETRNRCNGLDNMYEEDQNVDGRGEKRQMMG